MVKVCVVIKHRLFTTGSSSSVCSHCCHCPEMSPCWSLYYLVRKTPGLNTIRRNVKQRTDRSRTEEKESAKPLRTNNKTIKKSSAKRESQHSRRFYSKTEIYDFSGSFLIVHTMKQCHRKLNWPHRIRNSFLINGLCCGMGIERSVIINSRIDLRLNVKITCCTLRLF